MVLRKVVVEGLKWLLLLGQIHLHSLTLLNQRCQQSNVHVPPRWLARGLPIHSYLLLDLVPGLPSPSPIVPPLHHHSSPLHCHFLQESRLLQGNESTAQVQTRAWHLLPLELLPQFNEPTARAPPLHLREVPLVQQPTQPGWVPSFQDLTLALPRPHQVGLIRLVPLPLALPLSYTPTGLPVGDPRLWRLGALIVFPLPLLSKRWCTPPSGEAMRASVWSDCWGT